MKEQKLDAEEVALEAAYGAGEFISDFSAERAKEIQTIVEAQLRGDPKKALQLLDELDAKGL